MTFRLVAVLTIAAGLAASARPGHGSEDPGGVGAGRSAAPAAIDAPDDGGECAAAGAPAPSAGVILPDGLVALRDVAQRTRHAGPDFLRPKGRAPPRR